jgi:hypothetical protein
MEISGVFDPFKANQNIQGNKNWHDIKLQAGRQENLSGLMETVI